MGASYDGIILGTGHNALVLQAYLARSGLRILSLDRAPVPGGGLATEENPRLPGFWHNTHSFFHRAITAMPWYRDLALQCHGAHYVEPELNVALILPDGRSLQVQVDVRRRDRRPGIGVDDRHVPPVDVRRDGRDRQDQQAEVDQGLDSAI